MSPGYDFLPVDVQRLVSLYRVDLTCLELHIEDGGTVLTSPAGAATYVGNRLLSERCPLPDVLHAVALCAVKFATSPQTVEAS